MNFKQVIQISVFGLLVLFLPLSQIFGQATSGKSEEITTDDTKPRFRTYLAIDLARQSLPGDFDGYSFYSDGINLYTVPTLDPGTGFRISLGFRDNRIGGEVSYTTTTHNTDWLGITAEARHNEVGADLIYFLFPGSFVQPYGKIGLLLHFLVLPDGAIDLESDSLATLREMYEGGVGLRMGTGVNIKLTDSFGLRGEAVYRLGRFRTLAGRKINTLSATNFIFSAGLVYTFKR